MIKTLLAQVKEFKKASFLTPVFMILEVVVETMIPLVMADMIDNGVETTGAFVNGEDLIVKLTGVDLTSASFNTTFGTVAL